MLMNNTGYPDIFYVYADVWYISSSISILQLIHRRYVSFVSYVSCDWPIRILLDTYHMSAYMYYTSEYPYYSSAYVSCQLSCADLKLKNMKEGLLQSNTHCCKLGEFSNSCLIKYTVSSNVSYLRSRDYMINLIMWWHGLDLQE